MSGNRIKSFVAAVALAAVNVSPAHGDDKMQKSGDPQAQMQFIQKARDSMNKCALLYDAGRLLAKSEDHLAEAQRQAGQDSKPPSIPIYYGCVKDEKTALLSGAKSFIASFTAADSKSRAHDMVAQWMTAMDAIGTTAAAEESSKFQTLANGLLIDMQ